MGNKNTTQRNTPENGVSKQQVENQVKPNFNTSLSGRSFGSIISQQTTYSQSRPWSRVSRRRWRESTLTLPYEASKTAWPVTQTETYFLPEFPVAASVVDSKYQIVEEISKGSFGKVYKVQDDVKGQIFALKVLSKSKIVGENSVHQVKEEVQIQAICGHHPFLVACLERWQSRKKLFILSNYVGGGELFHLLKNYKILPQALVKLYIAQLALAVDFLHNAGIIYRDLKPENILLDDAGNIQLIDFGLSKWLSYGTTTRTICGTLRYMAPEILATEPYGHAVDWWSLGVLACLMMTGKYPTPALGPDPDNKETLGNPGGLPPDIELDVPSKDLLLRLLVIQPSKRLRSLRTLETIAFYKGYNFKDVREKRLIPWNILRSHYPNGPPSETQAEDFSEFDDELYLTASIEV